MAGTAAKDETTVESVSSELLAAMRSVAKSMPESWRKEHPELIEELEGTKKEKR